MKKILFFTMIGLMATGLTFLQSCQTAKSSTASKMLKFNFEKGKSYDYDMISDFDQDVMGQKQQISMTAQYGLDVTGSNNGVVDITTTFNAFRMNMEIMGMHIEADTEKPLPADTGKTPNPLTIMSRLFHAVKGQKFQMKVDQDGKVLEVTGMEEMTRNIINSLDLGDEFKETLDKTFKQQFNEASLREQFERAFFIFPGKEVKVGDSWEKEQSMPGGGLEKFKTKYTVDEIEGDMVHLDVKSSFSGSEQKGSMEGSQSGTMVVDSRSGLIMESDLELDIKAEENGQKMKMIGRIKIRGRERK